GVAEHDPARAFVVGGLGASECKLRIGLVAVEEMLAVEQHLAAPALRCMYAVADRGEIFLWRGLERHPHVIVPRLGDEADGTGRGFEQRGEAGIVRGRAARPPRHAEGSEGGRELALLRKKFGVDRIGTGVAALDIVDAEFIEHGGDRELVAEREIDAVGLRAIAQRGVEEIEAFAGHASPEVIVEHQRDRDQYRDDRDHEVVALEAGGGFLGFAHCGRSLAAGFAASCFSIVVLASHSLPSGTELRCCGTKPRRLKKPSALSLTSAESLPAPRAVASFSSASISMLPTPCLAAAGCT